jgi:hypothetical protein
MWILPAGRCHHRFVLRPGFETRGRIKILSRARCPPHPDQNDTDDAEHEGADDHRGRNSQQKAKDPPQCTRLTVSIANMQ